VPVSIATDGVGGAPIPPDSSHSWTQTIVGTEITQPWWLAEPRNGDLFTPRITGLSEDERERRSWAHVTVGAGQGTRLDVTAPIVYHYVDRVRGDVQRPLIVAPGISVALDQATTMVRANVPSDQVIKATIRSAFNSSTP